MAGPRRYHFTHEGIQLRNRRNEVDTGRESAFVNFLEEYERRRPAWMKHPGRNCAGRAGEGRHRYYGSADAVGDCKGCPVIKQCLEYALENHETGVWGGTSESQRQQMKKAT